MDHHDPKAESVRLDIWLDVACLFKTRSAAQKACTGGKIDVNGQTAKPHRLLRVGDELEIGRPYGRKQRIVVRALADRHRAKAEARQLYEDLTPAPTPDEIEMRRCFKEDIWDPALPAPLPIARRRVRLEVHERITAEGAIETPLDEESVRRAARRLGALGVRSLAIVFLHSYVNAVHEKRAREIVLEELPDLELVSLSHEVHPKPPEFERTSTTLVNAYVGPPIVRYLERLEATLRAGGYAHELLIATCSVLAYTSTTNPIALLVLGPITAFFATGYFSGFGAVTAELYPTEVRATAQGFTYNVGRVASAAAPWLVGSVVDTRGYPAALTLVAVAFVLASGFWIVIPETKGRAIR